MKLPNLIFITKLIAQSNIFTLNLCNTKKCQQKRIFINLIYFEQNISSFKYSSI